MTMLDGWVGEQISTDPAVVPSLEAAPQAVSVDRPTSQQGAKKPPEDKETSLVVKMAAAVLVAIGLAVGGTMAWPYISALLEPTETTAPPSGAKPTQQLVINGDTLYLEGSVPSEEASQQFEESVTGSVGSDRVINNFQISDDAVFDPSQPVELTVAETVLFSTGRADVSERYGPLIGLAVDLMESHADSTLTIIGHTDDIGEEETNLRLSMERARATANALISRGIDVDRIDIQGRGETEPLAPNDTVEGRQANRRVEFLIHGLFG